MATIQDVAKMAGVSPATVSRVLNGSRKVATELEERVRAAIAELDYRPSAVARNLRRQETTTCAVIVADVENPFFTGMVRGIADWGRTAGFSFAVFNTDESIASEDYWIETAIRERMAGVIVAPASEHGSNLRRLLDYGIHVVFVDRRVADCDVDTVLVDNREGSRVATRHLLDNGAVDVACIAGPRDVTTSAERVAGYELALRDAGRQVEADLVIEADFRERGGYAAVETLMGRGRRPDALFVANNLMTIGALRALHDLRISVPQDVMIVGFDDMSWAEIIRPPLTTVAQPTYEVGFTAGRLLTDRIGNPSRPPQTVVLPTELKIRASSYRQMASV